MSGIDELFQRAIDAHRRGELTPARDGFLQVLAAAPNHAGALNQLGLLARQAGQFDQAVEYLRRAIAIDGSQIACYANLAEAYRGLARIDEAIDCYQQAIRLAPRTAPLYTYLGTLLAQAGRTADALASFRQALALQPSDALAHFSLGNLQLSLGELEASVASFDRALAGAPRDANILLNRGVALKELGRLEDASRSFEQALAVAPRRSDAWLNLAGVAKAQGDNDRAANGYARALEISPRMVEAHNNWASLLLVNKQMPAAIEHLEAALAIDPDYLPARVNLAHALLSAGRTVEAIAGYDRVLAAKADDALAIKAALAWPVIIATHDEIDQVHQRLDQNLARLEASTLAVADPLQAIGVPAFYLAYAGRNERDFQARIARLLRRASPALEFVAPHCAGADRPTAAGRRIKVGFVSNHFHQHTIGKLNAGLIRLLDRVEFEVVVFRGPGPNDTMSQAIERSADVAVRLSPSLAAARSQIAELALDVLFYPDIGMEPQTYYLAHARLAPVQCVTWGHPLTTGIETIDFFLSSADLEPPHADDHYSEKLVRLSHLTNYYYRPDPPALTKSRSDFGFADEDHVYLCPQNLFKLHPDNDIVFGEILRRDPRAKIVLLEPQQPTWRELLCVRLRRNLGDDADRIAWVSRQLLLDFRQMLAVADVLLDPLGFGGGDTSYEGFAVGAPIVTLAGEFLRSRITYALYRAMGLGDCVALSAEDYVERAVRLGIDREWNARTRARILAANHALYECTAAVRELEDFLRQAVAAGERGR